MWYFPHIIEHQFAYGAITQFVEAVNELPYKSDKKLEQATVKLLENTGFNDATQIVTDSCVPPAVKNKTAGSKRRTQINKGIREGDFTVFSDIQELQEGLWYIDQPLGTSSYPDKLLLLYGRVVLIEEKSSRNSGFRFNNTPPHPKTFYIFSDARHNETKIMHAGHFINQNVYDDLLEAQRLGQEAHKTASEQYMQNQQLSEFFIRPSSRPQFNTWGGYENTDFVAKSNENGWHKEVVDAMTYQLKKGMQQHFHDK